MLLVSIIFYVHHSLSKNDNQYIDLFLYSLTDRDLRYYGNYLILI